MGFANGVWVESYIMLFGGFWLIILVHIVHLCISLFSHVYVGLITVRIGSGWLRPEPDWTENRFGPKNRTEMFGPCPGLSSLVRFIGPVQSSKHNDRFYVRPTVPDGTEDRIWGKGWTEDRTEICSLLSGFSVRSDPRSIMFGPTYMHVFILNNFFYHIYLKT